MDTANPDGGAEEVGTIFCGLIPGCLLAEKHGGLCVFPLTNRRGRASSLLAKRQTTKVDSYAELSDDDDHPMLPPELPGRSALRDTPNHTEPPPAQAAAPVAQAAWCPSPPEPRVLEARGAAAKPKAAREKSASSSGSRAGIKSAFSWASTVPLDAPPPASAQMPRAAGPSRQSPVASSMRAKRQATKVDSYAELSDDDDHPMLPPELPGRSALRDTPNHTEPPPAQAAAPVAQAAWCPSPPEPRVLEARGAAAKPKAAREKSASSSGSRAGIKSAFSWASTVPLDAPPPGRTTIPLTEMSQSSASQPKQRTPCHPPDKTSLGASVEPPTTPIRPRGLGTFATAPAATPRGRFFHAAPRVADLTPRNVAATTDAGEGEGGATLRSAAMQRTADQRGRKGGAAQAELKAAFEASAQREAAARAEAAAASLGIASAAALLAASERERAELQAQLSRLSAEGKVEAPGVADGKPGASAAQATTVTDQKPERPTKRSRDVAAPAQRIGTRAGTERCKARRRAVRVHTTNLGASAAASDQPSASVAPVAHTSPTATTPQAGRTEKLLERMRCTICTDIFEDPHALPCTHTFCYECIDTWSRQHAAHTCPLCKLPFFRRSIMPNYTVADIVAAIK